MNNFNWSQWLKVAVCLLLYSFVTALYASDLPFVQKTQELSRTIAGPFMSYAGTILFVVTCLMAAFGEWGEGFKKIIQIVFWISMGLAGSGVMLWMR